MSLSVTMTREKQCLQASNHWSTSVWLRLHFPCDVLFKALPLGQHPCNTPVQQLVRYGSSNLLLCDWRCRGWQRNHLQYDKMVSVTNQSPLGEHPFLWIGNFAVLIEGNAWFAKVGQMLGYQHHLRSKKCHYGRLRKKGACTPGIYTAMSWQDWVIQLV